MKKIFVKPQVSVQPLEAAALMASSDINVKNTTINSTNVGGFTPAAKGGSIFHAQDILLDI